MDHLEFTTALLRLNRHKIGITEAATLFSISDGATIDQLRQIFSSATIGMVKGRVQQIKVKKLCESSFDRKTGEATYRPTSYGRKIINETLKIQP